MMRAGHLLVALLATLCPYASSFRLHTPAGLTARAPMARGSVHRSGRVRWVSMQGASTATVVAHDIFMPALSSTMNEGKIVQWTKEEGDFIAKGDIVMVVESDKADMEVESFSEGYLAKKLVDAGGTANVGETVGLIAESKDDIAAVAGGLGSIPSGDANRHDGTTTVRIPPSPTAPSDSAGVPETFMDEAAIAQIGAREVFMPALSSTMTEGKVAKWLKGEGDRVEVGDVVMVVESDKADMDVESFEEGYLAKILVPEGSTARVGETCALIADTQEKIDVVRSAGVQAIASGSGSRHDGTTAVYDRSESPAAPATPVQAAPVVLAPSVPTTDLFMPALSSTMTEGKVTQWLKKVGDKVNVGEMVMVVESDKADMEVESFEEGYIAKVLVDAGDVANVGDPVALLVQSPEDIDKVTAAPRTGAQPAVPPPAAPAAAAATAAAAAGLPAPSRPVISFAAVDTGKYANGFVPPTSLDQDVRAQLPPGYDPDTVAAVYLDQLRSTAQGRAFLEDLDSTPRGQKELQLMLERVKIRAPPLGALVPPDQAISGSLFRESPHVRDLADKAGIDLSTVSGSGPGGRILPQDIAEAASGKREHWGKDEYYQQKKAVWTPAEGVVAATPMARRLAKEKGVDLSSVRGTGNFGRVTGDDVRRALGMPVEKEEPRPAAPPSKPAPPAPAGRPSAAKETAPVKPMAAGLAAMDGMQKAVARNMEATVSVPVFRVSRAIVTDAFDQLYKDVKEKGVTVSALLAKAVALTLEKHPILNAAYDVANGGSIRHPGEVNVAMAVALDGGLLTPVLKQANAVDIFQLSRDWKELVNKARDKKLGAAEMSTGTFYISNLGMMGVNQMDPILPPGVGAIMGVGAAIPRVTVQGNGFIGVQKEMTVTLTCDHRHIYGADAAAFLQDLAHLMENDPQRLLMG
ncbi:unnamed protein product [Vitrella brassicaformis CCMP3155]|uniref:Dihydrolipoamide acetyltransferase component of pyruvate dehydrogenase complex n=2 Tax=Vitrella brassicaformis TaxID=1169539 RepID=A0A0G4EJ84_VITBC|nr:unnamed protein product [Vitrella brassicaformis CCMP3155]|eukprot:CEL96769.1 unnamed protein product [Vitrella brassicaformis CCMP3155]